MNWKRPAEGVMPLTNGELRFQGDKDQTSIRTVQVVDAGGTVTRAWSGDGSPLAWPQISFHSSGQLFVLKVDSSTFRVSGEAVRVKSSAAVTARLAEYPRIDLAQRLDQGETVIEPRGWQRGGWFDVSLG